MMLTQFFDPIVGGEERMVEDLSCELVNRGHDVSVVTLRPAGVERLEVRGGLRVHRMDGLAQRASFVFRDSARRHAPPFPDPVVVRALRGLLAEEQPEIVHAHNWLVHSFLPLRRRCGARLVVSLHDYGLVCATKRLMQGGLPCSGPGLVKCMSCSARHYGVKGPCVSLAGASANRRLERHVDMFLPVSRAVAERSGLERNGLPYQVLPNFVPDALLEHTGGLTSERLERLPAGDFVLFAGDLRPEKGVDVLLAAHAASPQRLPLVLIGRPYDKCETVEGGEVSVLGLWPRPDLLEAWRRCAFAVVPSVWEEPFGIVALEAMAMGKPVIASRVGGLADIVEHGRTGILVPPGDVAALRDAIAQLSGDPGLRARMGAAAASRIREFTAATIVPRLEGIYRDLLG